MSSITKLKRKFKKIPAFITCAASQSHDSIKTNITFKVPLQISTELFSVCRLLQKIQQKTYRPKEDFKPLSVLTFSRPILHQHRFQSELSEIQSCRRRTKLIIEAFLNIVSQVVRRLICTSPCMTVKDLAKGGGEKKRENKLVRPVEAGLLHLTV